MVKKTTAVAAVAACSLSAVALAATTFSDVPADHWAADAIAWTSETGIMNGPGDMPGKFNPGGAVNRAELAVVSQRLYMQVMADVKAEMMMGDDEEEMEGDDAMEESEEEEMEEELTWEADADGMWKDKDGRMMRIHTNGELQASANGSSWGQVVNMQWMGTDGYWYKFDKDWNLSMSADGGETWEEAEMWAGEDGMWYMLDEQNKLWSAQGSVMEEEMDSEEGEEASEEAQS